jgi:hypothetical protein
MPATVKEAIASVVRTNCEVFMIYFLISESEKFETINRGSRVPPAINSECGGPAPKRKWKPAQPELMTPILAPILAPIMAPIMAPIHLLVVLLHYGLMRLVTIIPLLKLTLLLHLSGIPTS